MTKDDKIKCLMKLAASEQDSTTNKVIEEAIDAICYLDRVKGLVFDSVFTDKQIVERIRELL